MLLPMRAHSPAMAAATSPSVLARSCTQLRPRPRPRLRPPPHPRCLRSRARCITAPGVDEEPVHAPEIFESRPGERFLFQAGETLRIEELPEGTRVVVSGRRRERSPLSSAHRRATKLPRWTRTLVLTCAPPLPFPRPLARLRVVATRSCACSMAACARTACVTQTCSAA